VAQRALRQTAGACVMDDPIVSYGSKAVKLNPSKCFPLHPPTGDMKTNAAA
jgi:hypothetical protein